MKVRNNNDLIYNIKSRINEKGIKQKKVGEMIGLTEQQISDMLNGRRRIDPFDVYNLSIALGCTPNDLYGFTEKAS